MIAKTYDNVIDMITAVAHLFKHVTSERKVSLDMKLDSDTLIIQDLRTKTELRFTHAFSTTTARKYLIDQTDGKHVLAEERLLSLGDLPTIEDYIIATFSL